MVILEPTFISTRWRAQNVCDDVTTFSFSFFRPSIDQIKLSDSITVSRDFDGGEKKNSIHHYSASFHLPVSPLFFLTPPLRNLAEQNQTTGLSAPSRNVERMA